MFWVSLLWTQILICDFSRNLPELSFSQSKHLRRTDYDSWLREVKCYLWKRWSPLIKYRSSKKPKLQQKPELGQKCRKEGWAGDTYPVWPLWSLSLCLQWGWQGRLSAQSPQGSVAGEMSSFLCRIGHSPELLFMVVPWQKVLGVGLVLAAGKRKCFGIFVLLLMYFSYCIWQDVEKLLRNFWVFFISRKSPCIKVSLGLNCWDTQAPAGEGDEVSLWN